MAAHRNFSDLARFAGLASTYAGLRAAEPGLRAATALRAIRYADDAGCRLPEAVCAVTTGHSWSCSGTAYGGDDERWHGEGRCLCAYCGADGDA